MQEEKVRTFADCFTEHLKRPRRDKLILSKIAEETEMNYYALSRWKNGHELPSPADRDRLFECLHLTREERERFKKAYEYSLEQRVWAKRKRHLLGDGQKFKLRLEVYKSHREALEAAILLLETLPPVHGEVRNPTIKTTVQGYTVYKALEPEAPEVHQRWAKARLEALRKGWRMQPFWRLDGDPDRSLRWIDDILVVLQVGEYRPRFFKQAPHGPQGLLPAPYDLMLIPECGGNPARAVLFFATSQSEYVDAAVITSDKEFYEVLADHLNQLTDGSTEELLVVSPRGQRNAFLDEMGEWESQGGGRRLVKPDLSVLTLPEDVYTRAGSPWIERAQRYGMDVNQLLVNYQNRLITLRSGAARYRDIYSKAALEKWALKNGTYTAYQSVGAEIRATPAQVRDHIEHVIRMLALPTYEIALVEEQDQFRTEPLWLIAGAKRESVFIEVLKPRSTPRNIVNLRIDETHVVSAFREKFETKWEEIASDGDKNKQEVIKWLQALMAKVPNSYR